MFVLVRKFIFIIIGSFDLLFKRYPEVTVLCYHNISEIIWPFNTSLNTFKKQILHLEKTHQFITPEQYKEYRENNLKFKKPAILLTFDDGYKSILTIKKFLTDENIKPILFLESEPDKINRDEIDNDYPLLDTKDVQSLLEDKWVLASHGATHSNLLNLKPIELEREIVESKNKLENTFNAPIDYFAYARGFYDDKIVKKTKEAGYILAFSMDDEIVTTETDPMLIPRIGVMRSHGIVEFMATQTKTVVSLKKVLRLIIPI